LAVIVAAALLVAGCGERSRGPAAPPSRFGPTVSGASSRPGEPPPGMVWIPGGEYSRGSLESGATVCSAPLSDAAPIHRVFVDGFWMDATEVTNGQFEEFVRATSYVTVAERVPRAGTRGKGEVTTGTDHLGFRCVKAPRK
jgi:formylglycine-generating enzyme required for sulfatase activity